MSKPQFEITKAASFDAAHYMTHPAAQARYRRVHGHSFRVEVSVRGAAGDETGWVEDFGALENALRAEAERLDHSLLNEQPGLETPTLERLCLHFAAALKPRFPGLCRITVARPTAGEHCALALEDAA
jgi:6-pyruvoyltetrahydropterin/6-carboxytetrahydropterin synthase